jgi:hypothetical protein
MKNVNKLPKGFRKLPKGFRKLPKSFRKLPKGFRKLPKDPRKSQILFFFTRIAISGDLLILFLIKYPTFITNL